MKKKIGILLFIAFVLCLVENIYTRTNIYKRYLSKKDNFQVIEENIEYQFSKGIYNFISYDNIIAGKDNLKALEGYNKLLIFKKDNDINSVKNKLSTWENTIFDSIENGDFNE